jgi:hypothetical protein
MNMSDTNESQTAQEHSNEPNTRAEPASAPDDLAPPLLSLIASIRAGVVRGASAEVRTAGATACRAILSVLEAKPGQPLAASPQPTMSSASPASPLASLLSQPGLLSQLAAMSREELINLFKQITGATPGRAPTPSTGAPRFHLIEIPQVRKPDGHR